MALSLYCRQCTAQSTSSNQDAATKPSTDPSTQQSTDSATPSSPQAATGNQDPATKPSTDSSSQPSTDPNAQPPIQAAPQKKETTPTGENGKAAPSGTSNDRLFYTLPNFLSLETTNKLPPLTAKQKFGVVARGTFDYIEYPWWGILAAISQAENSEPAFGQGWASYGKRYGTTAADSTVENFMVGAVFPSLLRQDPRFYQLSEGSFTHRMFYSVSRIFVTRSDSGKTQFNFSEILGSASGAAISTYSYHPRSTYLSTPTNPRQFVPSERTLSNAFDVWYTQVSLDAITIVVKEFWPDIHRKMSHKPKSAQVGEAPQEQ
jgi:hypothetical protein